ncbi:MAG TPA: DNA polymerase III subunit delta' [Candidatus Cybelea sp.]|nr:DNA polymerase III subunit delta' [Candidatus Cybelea sp.]
MAETDANEDRDHPRFTTDLIGHDEAEAALMAAWNSGRMPHAWLIGGPRGVGKATLAYRMARFVLAQAGGGMFDAAPDARSLAIPPDHPVFRRVASRGHADLLVMERAINEKTGKLRTEITAEDARRVSAFFAHTAAEGGWRVCIVDAADEMNRQSANALLKRMEEPPPKSLLLIVAHSPGALLPTIRSRCRLLMLRPLDESAVAELLSQRLPDATAEERTALARLSEGCPGRALVLAESGGIAVYKELVGLFAGLPDLDVETLHAAGDRLARRDADVTFRVWTELFGWWLARLARAGATGEMPPEIVAGEANVLRRLGDRRRLDRWAEVWEKVGHLVERADSVNLDRKQVVLSALFAAGRAARA